MFACCLFIHLLGLCSSHMHTKRCLLVFDTEMLQPSNRLALEACGSSFAAVVRFNSATVIDMDGSRPVKALATADTNFGL